jgi:hypothetical protein
MHTSIKQDTVLSTIDQYYIHEATHNLVRNLKFVFNALY